MLWFLAITVRKGLRKSLNWTSDLNGAVAVAALLGISGILVHSLVDFNMQVPGKRGDLLFALYRGRHGTTI